MTARRKAELLALVAKKHKGELTPALVVKESDPKHKAGCAHELAHLVGWGLDDKKAAHRWREECARSVIQSAEPLLIEMGVVTIRAPHYVRDPSKGLGEQGYAPLLTVKTREEWAADTMAAEIDRAASCLSRAYGIAVALGFEDQSAAIASALGCLGRAAELSVGSVSEAEHATQ